MDEVQIHRTPNELGFAMLDAIASGELREIEVPSEHFFADGLYGRKSKGEAGSVIVTQKHTKQHITIALEGHCTVVDDAGNKREIVAPGVWITEPGTQRSIYCHSDVWWITVHANPENITDHSEIEPKIAENPFTEYRKVIADRSDYPLMLADLNLDADEVRKVSEDEADVLDVDDDRVEIKPSLREGLGVFARNEFDPEQQLVAVRVNDKRTPAGRYMNHSITPNAKFVLSENGIDAVAIRKINIGDEITINYRSAKDVSIEANSRLRGAL